MNQSEILKSSKELVDIRADYDKTVQLLNNRQWDELLSHLEELKRKYRAEKAIYNSTHCVPPQNIQENATNCLSFLNALYDSKAVSIEKDILKQKRKGDIGSGI